MQQAQEKDLGQGLGLFQGPRIDTRESVPGITNQEIIETNLAKNMEWRFLANIVENENGSDIQVYDFDAHSKEENILVLQGMLGKLGVLVSPLRSSPPFKPTTGSVSPPKPLLSASGSGSGLPQQFQSGFSTVGLPAPSPRGSAFIPRGSVPLSSVVAPLSSGVAPLSSGALSSVVAPLSSVVAPLSSVVAPLSNVVAPLSSVVGQGRGSRSHSRLSSGALSSVVGQGRGSRSYSSSGALSDGPVPLPNNRVGQGQGSRSHLLSRFDRATPALGGVGQGKDSPKKTKRNNRHTRRKVR